jgi:hypothetical protein
MSPSFASWLLPETAITAPDRAALAWARIQDKPTSIVFKPPSGASLAAQIVRIEVDNRQSMVENASGVAPRMQAVVYGIRGHATLADTVFAEGYRFILGNDEYHINDIILTIGEIQGIASATG